MIDWLTCQEKSVRMFLFPSSLYTTLRYFTVVLWYVSFVSSSVCRYHGFHAITFVQDKFEDTKGVTSSRLYTQRVRWPKEKRTNHDLQNTTQETKDCETRTPLQPGCELRCSGKVGSSCFTSATDIVISHESGKDGIVITTKRTSPLSFATHILCSGCQSHDGDGKTFRSDDFFQSVFVWSLCCLALR